MDIEDEIKSSGEGVEYAGENFGQVQKIPDINK